MKPRGNPFEARPARAFSLIELIGVLAIMAILASVLVPNVLKSIDRAAVKAEAETLGNLGDAAKLYLRDTSVEPTSANWSTALGAYASLNPTDLLTNRRHNSRIYVADPVAANERALLVSSMRAGLALPSVSALSANFDAVWNWSDAGGIRPAGFAAVWDNALDYLIVERINYRSIYKTYFATVVLNNASATQTVSYQVAGASPRLGDIASGDPPISFILGPKDQLNLFRQANEQGLDYTFVGGGANQTFYFSDSGGWLPQ
jgi:prepilin-type N-terminal cleavage/methylation domain-containing protein